MATARALTLAACLALVASRFPTEDDREQPLSRLHFGSCNKHDREQPAWNFIASRGSQLFAWLGDIIYADAPFLLNVRIPADAPKVLRCYQAQKAQPQYARFAQSNAIDGVFDDHDTGQNNADRTFDPATFSKVPNYLMDFLDEPRGTARRARSASGVFTSHLFGKAPRRVHLLLLDNRTQRDPYEAGHEQDMLGREQWEWLREQLLAVRTEITIIGAGLQVLSRGDPSVAESWSRLPESQAKLLALLAETRTQGVFFISGDVHFTELNRVWMHATAPDGSMAAADSGMHAGVRHAGDAPAFAVAAGQAFSQPLYDFTSSGLTHSWGGVLKTAVVRGAMMHSTRVQAASGLSQGEEHECNRSNSSRGFPTFCRLRDSAAELRAASAAHGEAPVGIAALPGPYGDMFSSEQNFGQIDIAWATKPAPQQSAYSSLLGNSNNGSGAAAESPPMQEEEEVVDLERTVITFTAVGATTNATLWRYSFPLSHIYPQPLSAAAAEQARIASQKPAQEPVPPSLLFLYGLLGKRRLFNGEPLPANATAAPLSASDVHACAASGLKDGFTPACGRFLLGVLPHQHWQDHLRFYAGHFVVFGAIIGAFGSFLCAPILVWACRRKLPGSMLAWYSAYAVATAAFASYLYSLG